MPVPWKPPFLLLLLLPLVSLAQPYQPRLLLDMIGEPRQSLGGILEPVGDQDGDGYDDILIEAHDPSLQWDGHYLRLIYGGPSAPYRTLDFAHLPDTSSTVLNYDWYNQPGNYSLCQDYNGDGHTDIMVGLYDGEYWDYLELMLFLGGPELFDTLADWRSAPIRQATAVSVGDYDANGTPDWVMGNMTSSQYTLRYLSNAWPNLASTPTWEISRYRLGGQFTRSYGVGDVTGDGWPDFMFHTVTDSNRYQIWFGGPGADSLPDYSRPNQPWWDPTLPIAAGWAIIGDVNGDGIHDLVAETFEDPYEPVVRIWHGGLPLALPVQADVTIERTSVWMYGTQNFSLGDINGDGCEDIAFWERNGFDPTLPVRIVVYLGGNPMDGQHDLILGPDFGGFRISGSYNRAGDLNGDGLEDWMVQSSDTSNQWRGRVTVIAGDRNFGVFAEERPEVIATDFRLGDPYPNPFNSSVTIPLVIDGAHPKLVDVKIYNLLGQVVYEFGRTLFAPGVNTLRWDGRSASNQIVATGSYIVRVRSDNQTTEKTIQLLR